MKRLLQILGIVWVTLFVAWFVLCTKPGYGVGPLFMVAAAVEVSFYVAVLWQPVQDWIKAQEMDRRIQLIVASALLPYLIYAPIYGQFDLARFALMAGLVALATLFYRNGLSIERDLWFLLLMAAVVLLDLDRFWFTGGDKRLPASAMGKLMWIRVGIASLLFVRDQPIQMPPLWPQRSDWRLGGLVGLAACAAIFPISALIGFGSLRGVDSMGRVLLTIPLTFFGILWVVALSEEFFFRGLLLKTLDGGLRSQLASLVLTSVLFGAVHLPARQFPNWKFALLATLAGFFYAFAARKSPTLGAAMVAHALVVSVWRLLY